MATLIFFTVLGVVAVATYAIHRLGESSNTVLGVVIPLQREILLVHDLQRQAEFYEQLSMVLPHQGYAQTAQSLLRTERQHLGNLLPDLSRHPHLRDDLQRLLSQLNDLLNRAPQDPVALKTSRTVLENSFQQLQTDLNHLFTTEAQEARRARLQAIWLLFSLLAFTAILALLIPWRVAVVLSRPLRRIRQALERISSGGGVQVATSGPQELREIALSLVDMQARLAEEEQLRHLFLSQVSHELKTPLASARSGSELLLSERLGPLLPRQREVLEIIARQVVELSLAIQEMLDMHALQARNLVIQARDCAVDALLREVTGRLQPLLENKQQRLQVDATPDLHVHADPQRFLQIISNVISNAYKHSPEGSDIRLSACTDGDGVRFCVEDTGPGIPSDLLDRVFENFYQVPRADGLHKGTGLGLPITRELLRALGGWIRLENRDPGLAAIFYLPSHLPQSQGTPCPENPAPSS